MSGQAPGRTMRSEYMHWAKSCANARYNIGASGVADYPLSSLPAALGDLEITGHHYYGYPPLLEAIALHAGVRRENVFAALGTSQANHLAMAVLLQPGDEALLEEPVYEPIEATARYLGATIRRVPRRADRGFAVDPDEVGRLLGGRTRLVVLTNLHNPSSAPVDVDVLRAIGAACGRRGARVLVDEAYLDAAWGRGMRSAATLGPEFVATNSLTKAYGLSGLRCGWTLAEPAVVDAMWRLRDLFESIPPHIPERLSVLAFRHLDVIRERARSLVEENRVTARALLLSRDDIDCVDPGIGTVLFPRLLRGTVDRLAADLAARAETQITPGRFFGMPDRFRIGLGKEPEIFGEGMRRLCAALDAGSGPGTAAG